MAEIGRLSEIVDLKDFPQESNAFKEIKPDGSMLFQEAQDFLKKLFEKESIVEKGDATSQNVAEGMEQSLIHEEIRAGEVPHYDDNGILYRVGNELIPENSYEINGYRYVTDADGRIISAEGNLHLKDREGRLPIKDSIEDIGKGYERIGDDRGHLIGDQFDGSNGLENMVPQDAEINRNDFKNFENELAKEVKSGKEVYYTVEPVYDEDSRRPSALVVTYGIEGKENMRIFPNEREE